MKRLIALLIAILTLLFGGVRTFDEPQEVHETEAESVTELSAEKENPDAAAEAEADQPEVIIPFEPETTEDETERPVEPADEPTPDIDTSFSQITEEPAPEEQTEMPEPTVQIEPPAVIPPTPVIAETAPSDNGPVFVNPAHGGPNPFENAPPTEIEDHPIDEFIEEGDDRPGEGIHF